MVRGGLGRGTSYVEVRRLTSSEVYQWSRAFQESKPRDTVGPVIHFAFALYFVTAFLRELVVLLLSVEIITATSACGEGSNRSGGAMTPEEIEALENFQLLRDQLRRPRIACRRARPTTTTATTAAIDVTGSRLGGPFAWPKKTDEAAIADDMVCLAQINLGELPTTEEKMLPEKGILQIFITDDDMYGREDYANGFQGDGFRIVVHCDLVEQEFTLQTPKPFQPDQDVSNVEYLFEKWNEMSTTGVPLEFTLQLDVAPTVSDYRLHRITESRMVVNSVGGAAVEGTPEFLQKFDEIYEELMEETAENETDCWLLGHPRFTQTDVRELGGDKRSFPDYEPLISFQSREFFMWGDCGAATFLMPEKDLATINTKDAIYSWDCC